MAESLINTAILEITEAVQTLAHTAPASTFTNPKLARLRRRRNRLVAMLMFSISGVAASCMPEFARIGHVERDPWASEDEDEDEDDGGGADHYVDIDDDLNPHLAAGVNALGLGAPPPMPMPLPTLIPTMAVVSGTGEDTNTFSIPSAPPQPAAPPGPLVAPPDEADDWINDALSGGGYISQALSTAFLRSSRNAGALSANGLEVKVADGAVVKLKSHPREVRRLVAVFDRAWRTVLDDLDIVRAQQFLERRQRLQDQKKARMNAWLKKDKEGREREDRENRGMGEEQSEQHLLAGKGKGKEKEAAFFSSPTSSTFTKRVDQGRDLMPEEEFAILKVTEEGSPVRTTKDEDEEDFYKAVPHDFDPFRTDRPDVVAHEAVRRINRIGKRIVRRVQLDRRVLVARTKKNLRNRELMRTGSPWRALVH